MIYKGVLEHNASYIFSNTLYKIMADFLEEVKEDLKRERFEKLFKDYGGYFAAIIIAIIAGTASVTWYGAHLEARQVASSDKFAEALIAAESDKEKSLSILSEIYENGSEGMKEFAGIKKAAMIKEKNPLAAIALYDEIIADSSVDISLRDLAALHATSLLIENSARENLAEQVKTIDYRLALLAAEGRPWRFSAIELQAIYALKSNEKEKALEKLSALQKNSLTPTPMKERAEKIIAILEKNNS